jgi:haloalkane dehalogenase
LVLEENQFLPKSLANGIKRPITDGERAAYYAPFPDPASRRPMLQWPREIPIDGAPADVTAVVTRYDAWLAGSPKTPKLLLTFDAPGVLGAPAIVEWARTTFAALDVVALGPAGHHAPEDLPHDIGRAVAGWLDRHDIARR